MVGGDTVRVNLRGLFLALLVVIVLIFFAFGATMTGDPLWFLPIFSEKPMQIIVYQSGCSSKLVEGQPGFEELMVAINQALTQYEGFNSSFGMSPETTKEYREKERAVEVFYPKPVTIHTPYRTGQPSLLFIPLSGYLGDSHSVFGGTGGEYWAGALRLKSIEAIQRAAEQVPCKR